VRIAPDRRGAGTNALYLQPVGAIPVRFGRGSLARHIAAAADRAIPAEVIAQPGLALDIDTPADLASFLAGSGGPHTRTFLAGLPDSVVARLASRG
jgi:2-phospho-L-lactate guanylyltransferase (CobY/MobA/RfbA family)